MDIEYQDEFEALQERHSFKGQQWFGERQDLVETYSWAIPTSDVIRYCANFDDLLEVGAGNGYWSSLIQSVGGTVTPTDINPPDETYTPVEPAGVRAVPELAERPVLMVWPPYGEDVAGYVAGEYPPHILYVGEGRGGCTADKQFFDIVESEYGLVGKLDIPSYLGVHDNFFHYARTVPSRKV